MRVSRVVRALSDARQSLSRQRELLSAMQGRSGRGGLRLVGEHHIHLERENLRAGMRRRGVLERDERLALRVKRMLRKQVGSRKKLLLDLACQILHVTAPPFWLIPQSIQPPSELKRS